MDEEEVKINSSPRTDRIDTVVNKSLQSVVTSSRPISKVVLEGPNFNQSRTQMAFFYNSGTGVVEENMTMMD
jgi:hypothetical protein